MYTRQSRNAIDRTPRAALKQLMITAIASAETEMRQG